MSSVKSEAKSEVKQEVVEIQFTSDQFYSSGVKKYDAASGNFYHADGKIAYDAGEKRAFYDDGQMAYDVRAKEIFYTNSVKAYDFEDKAAFYSNGDRFAGEGTVEDISFKMHLTGRLAEFKQQLGRGIRSRVVKSVDTITFYFYIDEKLAAIDK